MERTIEDLFGRNNGEIPRNSFMKPPAAKKQNFQQDQDKENSRSESLPPNSVSSSSSQSFTMKPPTMKPPTMKPPSIAPETTLDNDTSSHVPLPSPSSTAASTSAAPAFILKQTPNITFKYQIFLQDWFLVSVEDSLIALGRRVDIGEMWKSEPISLRLDQRTFLSASHVQYHLIGPPKPPSQLAHQQFSEGIPALWKQLIN